MTTMMSQYVSIPCEEYEALTVLESHVRKMNRKMRPLDKGVLDLLLERIRLTRM